MVLLNLKLPMIQTKHQVNSVLPHPCSSQIVNKASCHLRHISEDNRLKAAGTAELIFRPPQRRQIRTSRKAFFGRRGVQAKLLFRSYFFGEGGAAVSRQGQLV